MAGRRRDYSGVAQGLSTVAAGLNEDTIERRKFQQRLQEAGIKAGLESGQIAPQFQGGQFTGFGQPPQQTPLSLNDIQSQLGGGGARGGSEQPRDAQGQFTTTITQDFDQFGRVKGFKVNRAEVKPQSLTPRQQLESQLMAAQGQLQSAQATSAPAMAALASPSRPSAFLSDAVMGQQPQALMRGREIAQEPVRMAQSQLGNLHAQAGVVRSAFPSTSGTDEFRTDLQAALQAIQQGKSRAAVIQSLLETYPDKSTQINTFADALGL